VDFITKPANTDILHHRIDLHLEFSAYQLHLERTVKELQDNIGVSFAELVECKDFNVAGHVMRTGLYAELLSAELYKAQTFKDELKPEDADLLKRASPFHDIGKIGVSDTILRKRGPLSDEEYLEVQKHTVIGSQILEQIYNRTPSEHYLKTAMTVALGHHERFDGLGYPKGLKGNDIPLFCRILSVANVYDTCVTDRVYHMKSSHELACKMILGGRGTEFDPLIVDVFDRIQDKFALLQTAFPQQDFEWSFLYETSPDY
jgi:putative two-component system response regulator